RAIDPLVPHAVHALEVRDIAQPDLYGEQLALVGTRHGEIPVDLCERVTGLLDDIAAEVIGDHAGQVGNPVVSEHPAKAGPILDMLDAHAIASSRFCGGLAPRVLRRAGDRSAALRPARLRSSGTSLPRSSAAQRRDSPGDVLMP